MKQFSIISRLTMAMLAAASFSSIAHAGNTRICSPMLASVDVVVRFPNGGFAQAGDSGSDRILAHYDNESGQRILYKGYQKNFAGGGDYAANKLCHIDQATDLGGPATLIMVFGKNSDCNNWFSWAQVQSGATYSGCDVSGNTVTLK
jgi:hypothetical protein